MKNKLNLHLLKKNQNFKMLWIGRLISNAGDSIYLIVLSWYILQSTNNPLWVGVLQFAILSPSIFQFLLGKTIDNSNKKTALIICEVGQMVSVAAIFSVIFLNVDNPILICIFAFVASGFGLNIFTIQDVFIPQILKKKDLVKAQSYMAFAYRGTEYLFNTLTGVLIKLFSTSALLFVNIWTFLLAIFFFRKINYTEAVNSDINQQDIGSEQSNIEDKKEGIFFPFKLIYRNKPILIVTITTAIINLMFGGLNVYIVLIADTQNNSILYGLLLGSASVGLLIGSTILISKLGEKYKYGKIHALSILFFGVFISLAGLLPSNYSILVPFFTAFLFLGMYQVVSPVIFQVLVEPKNLGKVTSAYATLSVSTVPLGALLFGILGKLMSPSTFLVLFGVVATINGFSYIINQDLFTFNTNEENEESVS